MNVISQDNNFAKRRFRDKYASEKNINQDRAKAYRINPREQVKIVAQTEDRNVMKTPREIRKEECRDAHAMQNLHI